MATAPDRTNAACRNHDPDLWFPDEETEDSTIEAKVICLGCPIHNDCQQYALDTEQPAGVWGGLDTEERGILAARLAVWEARDTVDA